MNLPMKIYPGGGSAALKPLTQNQQYKKQLEICFGMCFIFFVWSKWETVIISLIKAL